MDPALEIVRREALWFEPTAQGMGPLVDAIGDARLVLIGEATHGTHEFYRARAELTRALISGRSFNVVAVEADWPDAYRVNRWVRHATAEAGGGADSESEYADARLRGRACRPVRRPYSDLEDVSARSVHGSGSFAERISSTCA